MAERLELRDYAGIIKVYLVVYLMVYLVANFLTTISPYHVSIAVGIGLSLSGIVLSVQELHKENPFKKSLQIYIGIPSLLVPMTALIVVLRHFA